MIKSELVRGDGDRTSNNKRDNQCAKCAGPTVFALGRLCCVYPIGSKMQENYRVEF